MEPASLYRKTLKRAWHTTRTHPHVWILGLFAALLGNGGEFDFVVTQFNRFSNGSVNFGETLLAMFGTGGSTAANVIAALLVYAANKYVLLGVVMFMGLLIAWLVVSAQGGLIRAVATPNNGSLVSHFIVGTKSFWQLLGIILSTRLLAFFVLGVVGMPLFALLLYFMDPFRALVLVSFVLGVPLLMIASLITKYAAAYRMLERHSMRSAIVRAFTLFFDHWLVSIELVLTLFVINVAVGGAMIIFVLVSSMPFLALANALAVGSVGATAFLFLGRMFAFLLLIALGSILATFQYASWTELFLRITHRKHASKIMRVVTGLHQKYR
ncbi:hypothetical protein BK004_01725 [bacterium CG10_46_32]|nr:MAG: hypothetical protein BK004_01725 [bacterium CG10_46_32]PIR56261.1 MAG: hypothetical protein COU73_01755 [Parcubacteria group bacterium CG10_big_fil_rev_8_21_14_0_10_46_32]